jgi:hypothetical protein
LYLLTIAACTWFGWLIGSLITILILQEQWAKVHQACIWAGILDLKVECQVA